MLVVGLHGRVLFRKPEAEANERVHVRIRNVVNQLSHGPAAIAIRRIELGVCLAVEGLVELAGEITDVGDGGLSGGMVGERRVLKLADGVAGV